VLRLTGARRYLTRFTDRPLRRAAVVATSTSPGASRATSPARNQRRAHLHPARRSDPPCRSCSRIGQPRWNAKRRTWSSQRPGSVSGQTTSPGTTVHIKPPRIPNPRSFKRATLLTMTPLRASLPQPVRRSRRQRPSGRCMGWRRPSTATCNVADTYSTPCRVRLQRRPTSASSAAPATATAIRGSGWGPVDASTGERVRRRTTTTAWRSSIQNGKLPRPVGSWGTGNGQFRKNPIGVAGQP